MHGTRLLQNTHTKVVSRCHECHWIRPRVALPVSQLAVRTSLFIQRLKLVLCRGYNSVSVGEQPMESTKNPLAEEMLHHPRSPSSPALASVHLAHKNQLTLNSSHATPHKHTQWSLQVCQVTPCSQWGVHFCKNGWEGAQGNFFFFNFQFQTLSFRVSYNLLFTPSETGKVWTMPRMGVTRTSCDKFLSGYKVYTQRETETGRIINTFN